MDKDTATEPDPENFSPPAQPLALAWFLAEPGGVHSDYAQGDSGARRISCRLTLPSPAGPLALEAFAFSFEREVFLFIGDGEKTNHFGRYLFTNGRQGTDFPPEDHPLYRHFLPRQGTYGSALGAGLLGSGEALVVVAAPVSRDVYGELYAASYLWVSQCAPAAPLRAELLNHLARGLAGYQLP